MLLEDEADSYRTRIDYINDGVYGAFNCTLFDHQIVHPVVMTLSDVFQEQPDFAKLEECSVWGEFASLPYSSISLTHVLVNQDPPATRST